MNGFLIIVGFIIFVGLLCWAGLRKREGPEY